MFSDKPRANRMRMLIAGIAVLASAAIAAAMLFSGGKTAKSRETPLVFGVMPDSHSLPFLVAEAEGLFQAEGVEVKLQRFTSAQERDAAFQAGAIDGEVADLLAAVYASASGFGARITSSCDGRYGIVAAQGKAIASLADLRGKKIGLSTNTVIHYAVELLLEKGGVPAEAYEPLAVPKIPVRMEMLLAGQLDAAGLPEPFLCVAERRGARIVGGTDELGVDAAVVLFSRSSLDGKSAAIKSFYRAYEAACASINAAPDSWRPFLVEKAGFPAETKDAFVFPEYRAPRLPATGEIERAIGWMRAKAGLAREVRVEDLLDRRFTDASAR